MVELRCDHNSQRELSNHSQLEYPNAKKILLLSPYDAMSHQYWRKCLVSEISAHDFTVVSLPARHFSWRFRGNSLSLAHDEHLDERYDLVIATSITDLSALVGMKSQLASVPAILYFHENQFAFPERVAGLNKLDSIGRSHLVERQITSIYAAVSADRLVFNSEYNKFSFLSGADKLLQKMPDFVPSGLVASLENKSQVIPVPLDKNCFQKNTASDRFKVVWNHRWKWDKGLTELKAIVHSLVESQLDFEFHLIGQQFENTASEMTETVELLKGKGHLGRVGFVESRQDYLELLARSHCVLSTAHHEFQGLAIMEAMASGCVPVVPDRLVYPEFIDQKLRYDCVEEAVEILLILAESPDAPADLSIETYSWQSQRQNWLHLIASVG